MVFVAVDADITGTDLSGGSPGHGAGILNARRHALFLFP